MTQPIEVDVIEAFRCDDCGAIFETPGGVLFACSRCGGHQAENNRCEQCNIFMAKLGEPSCPECEVSVDLTEITAWHYAGDLYESREAIDQYIEEAPMRAKKREESEAYMEQWRAEQEIEYARIDEGLALVREVFDGFSEVLDRHLWFSFTDANGVVQRKVRDARDCGSSVSMSIEDLIRLAKELGELRMLRDVVQATAAGEM